MDEKEAVRDYVEAEAQGRAGELVLVASFNPPDDPLAARVYRVDFTLLDGTAKGRSSD